MASKNDKGDEPIIIKKYANRRLYNTQSSSYITLDDLARMTREGVDFQVLDAKTGSDITHAILTQIIMEEEASGEQMLPVSFLRQLISMYGNSMQAMMPSYLEATMDNFRANQANLQEAFKSSMGPDAFAKMAETNMAMFQAAAEAFIPKGGKAAKPAAGDDDDLDELRAQMKAMQDKLDKMGD
ncbi:polyhydroxyalkanoate synthesis repressor PhaR [Alteraurantiacibacter aquimixticola]|uniref:Polyhydroxyalkanoate synthesis repressor PhaR n=1 Tax=Alteraurantiacibacter aquimixticola TaxID=2489173 RepID=A0A4T3EZ93_9SPHN|nr:polyhydroxyalkanoate synthesis repressor PhaR [Alteraurantiacibacter aquimixticola]TIX50069.1 polyhydroxyalkanoate synthesis repressor PhaR [Alteraurantiacibacter aquimixticola]